MTLNRMAPGRVATVEPSCTVAEAARLMTMFSVGALVISDAPDVKPRGIITDRDLVKLIGEGLDPKQTTVGSFAEAPLLTASVDASPRELLRQMGENGIRRLPLLDDDEKLAGIVSLDDLLLELGQELGDIALAIRKEFRGEDDVPPLAHERTL